MGLFWYLSASAWRFAETPPPMERLLVAELDRTVWELPSGVEDLPRPRLTLSRVAPEGGRRAGADKGLLPVLARVSGRECNRSARSAAE